MPLKSEILYKFLESKTTTNEENKNISESEEEIEENKQGKNY